MKRCVVESLPFAGAETTHIKPKFKIEENGVEEEISHLGREYFGELASSYLKSYKHNARFLDKQYGIRREDNGRFTIGCSILTVDDTSDISINSRHIKGNRGIWKLSIFENFTIVVVTADDLKRYKTILQLTNAHLQG